MEANQRVMKVNQWSWAGIWTTRPLGDTQMTMPHNGVWHIVAAFKPTLILQNLIYRELRGGRGFQGWPCRAIERYMFLPVMKDSSFLIET